MNTLNKFHETTKSLADSLLAFALAVAAAVLIKVPALFGIQLDQDESFYIRNMSFFVLPLLTGYFVWKRKIESRTLILLTSGTP